MTPETEAAIRHKTPRPRLDQIRDRYARLSKDESWKRRYQDIKNAYHRKRWESDPSWRFRIQLKKALWAVLKKNQHSNDYCSNLFGCSKDQLRQKIQIQFEEGMHWDNYGRNGWCIDHIIPCCRFDLTDEKQRKVCFHYSNLQPLWYKDNQYKSISFQHD